MATIPVVVKHQGTKYDVEVDTDSTGEVFKFQLYSLTGVEPERQKILIKGGQVKDDTPMSKFNFQPGQSIMMLGTPGNKDVLTRPKEPVKFVEDMTEAEAAQQEGAIPAGLTNLGNTCYLNSTLQTLRAIPELQNALGKYEAPSSAMNTTGLLPPLDLTKQLRDLYKSMSETQEPYAPHTFLTSLRSAFPQFAERSRTGNGFAQQDAEEAWSQIVTQLRQKLRVKDTPESPESSFIDKYMSGELTAELECDEPAAREGGEKPVVSKETFLKLSCHIDGNTNHLRDGIANGLSEKIEKRSEVLGREAVYTKTSKISRLPKYLTVQFVRFFWKRETQKKAKIMRKVTFPHELDLVEFCDDKLKGMLVPVRDKVREVRKDEEDIERARKRRKRNGAGEDDIPGGKGAKKEDSKASGTSGDGDVEMGETYKTDAEIDAERDAALLAAKKELNALIDPALANDDGANQSGLYELRGVVTHQGASADSGHYTSYVKKSAPVDAKTGKRKEEDGKWWWFNDDKVSEVTADKIEALAGGGESHSALILLYRAIPLPSAEGTIE
ncbi:cysteine proteinase [Annulohypoxylon truncatum]|uniref:cysteine proteinase n=1 Tax=Annulohypoxylon truncatum TaxID=327061 RepID=UPI002008E549|nr:cysteine proteinase [Annulohypoxylon truncatum]KAI1212798.1 cysteine proteinase [Annulohypoxylon truncatum]